LIPKNGTHCRKFASFARGLRAQLAIEVNAMRASVYGALVAKPIAFPNDLEIRLFPVRSHDDSQIGKACFVFEDHRSWDWLRECYPMNSEAEPHIKAGEPISVRIGWITTNFPKGTEFPEGSEFKILEL
jgi:hypothetical protein